MFPAPVRPDESWDSWPQITMLGVCSTRMLDIVGARLGMMQRTRNSLHMAQNL